MDKVKAMWHNQVYTSVKDHCPLGFASRYNLGAIVPNHPKLSTSLSQDPPTRFFRSWYFSIFSVSASPVLMSEGNIIQVLKHYYQRRRHCRSHHHHHHYYWCIFIVLKCLGTQERYLTIIPRARKGSESVAHEAEGQMGSWLRGHEGERNNSFSKIQLVGQKISRQNNFN